MDYGTEINNWPSRASGDQGSLYDESLYDDSDFTDEGLLNSSAFTDEILSGSTFTGESLLNSSAFTDPGLYNDSVFTDAVLDNDSFYFNSSNLTTLIPEVYDPEIENMKVALQTIRYVVQFILVPMVSFVGVFGNMTTITVLTRKHMRSSTNFYLTALAISDMLYLILFFSLSLQHHPGMNEPHTWIYWHYSRFAMWLTDASSATSTWLTVTFTVERYIAVCHPMKGKAFCTPSRAKRVIMAVFLLCYALTATTPHEWTVANKSTNSSHIIYLDESALGKNKTYRAVFFWFSSVVFTLLPILMLFVFNSFLINTVNKSGVRRKTLSERPRNEKGKGSQSQEKKITLMLIAVVVLALVCQTPAAIALLVSSVHIPDEGSRDDYAMRILGNLFNLLTACNAALNFVLYCVLSDKFRKTFVETFCKRCVHKPSPQTSYTQTGYNDDHSPKTSRASSLHYSRRNSSDRRSSNASSTSRLSPTHRPTQTPPPNSQYLVVPSQPTNHHPSGEQTTPLLQKPSPPSQSRQVPRSLRLVSPVAVTTEPVQTTDTVILLNGVQAADSSLCSDSGSVSSSTIGYRQRARLRNPIMRLLRSLRSSSGGGRRRNVSSSNQSIIITCNIPSQERQTTV